ncbi:hypothetical protein TrRE_jg8331 [Triparma retinervis]|uniref:Uncharacterized protein n=1 Tax=Triparma retinervis TaxID=2557542 RepID=A0A9W7AKH4_9STRA|nr:hypothetical protein TrRE_jg8331 [Triparma retinervis]
MGYEQDFTRSSSRNASGGRKRRKFSDSAGRSNNKRFVWPDQKHREFVSAVFDVGLKSSTPSLILAAMRSAETFTPEMTTERIKSHLQKFRVHRVKSREEFLRSYEACKKELDEGADRNDGAEPEEGKEGDGRKEGGRGGSFLDDSKDEAVDTVSGANAALATYGSINFPDSEFDRSSSSRSELLTQASNPGKTLNAVGQGDVWGIRGIGDLTEGEKLSRVGVAITHMAKAMEELRDEVLKSRALEAMGGETGMTKEEGKAMTKSKAERGQGRQQDSGYPTAQQQGGHHAPPHHHLENGNSSHLYQQSAPPISVIPHLPVAANSLNYDLNNIPNPTLPSSLSMSMRTHLEIQDKMRKVKQDEIIKWSNSAHMSGAGTFNNPRNSLSVVTSVPSISNSHASLPPPPALAPPPYEAGPLPRVGEEAATQRHRQQPTTPLLTAAKSDLLFPSGTAWDADMDDNIFEFLEGMVDMGTEDGAHEGF